MHSLCLVYQFSTGLLRIASNAKSVCLSDIEPCNVKSLVLNAMRERVQFTIEFIA